MTSTFLGIGGAGLFDATIGPLILLLLPFLLLTWQTFDESEQGSIKSMLLLAGLGVIVWYGFSLRSVFSLQTRLVMHIFPPLLVLVAISFDRLSRLPDKPLKISFLLRTATAIVLMLTLLDHISGTRRPEDATTLEGTTTMSHFLDSRSLEYFFGTIDEDEYLVDNLGRHIAAMEALDDLPDDSHVLFLWETRSLYCPEPSILCEEDTIIMRWYVDRQEIGSHEDILASWQARGVDYLLVWDTGREFEFEGKADEFFTEADIAAWENLTEDLPIIWRSDDSYLLYDIRPESLEN